MLLKPSTQHPSAPPQRTNLMLLPVVALILSVSLSVNAQQSGEGPELRLFSSDIVESIRSTSEAASSMENGMIEVIETMDRQMALFKASNCEDAGQSDTGCAEMRSQLMGSYGQMLDTMSEALPTMQTAIDRSRDGLKRSLSTQIGRKISATDLQDLLLEDNAPRATTRQRRNGRSGISKRFEQYFGLVAQNVGGVSSGRGALAVTAADMYLDMEDASELIQITQDQIDRTRLFVQLEEVMPGMTDQMELTVNGAKSLLFGEPDESSSLDLETPPNFDPVPGSDSAYTSPLEL